MTDKLSAWADPGTPFGRAAGQAPYNLRFPGGRLGSPTPVGATAAPRAAYDEDFCAWAAEQAAALRAGQPYSADLTNLAEEIEDLGKSRRDRLASHIATVIEHLMKLEASPAAHPRAGWRGTVVRARNGIQDVLAESPSLRSQVPGIIARETERARRAVAEDLADYGEPSDQIAGLTYDEGRVLGDWLPER
jgi:hypothetical protein